jgi:hypothetical protein
VWRMKPLPARPELERLLKASVKAWLEMPPEDQEATLRRQRDGWVRAEMSWPNDCPYK